MNTGENDPIFGEPIFRYTSEQAEADGILFDVTQLNPEWRKGPFNYVTTNLLSCGYMTEEGKVNVANLLDLLNQALEIVRKRSEGSTTLDWFFSGDIELPSGEQQQIFIDQNETGKFTLMLPEDY